MPKSSCSVSRKVSLSSTRTTRIGSLTEGSVRETRACSLGGEQQRVMRLAAGMDVELDPGVLGGELCEERLERRRLLAGQERHDTARLGEQALEHRVRDLVERVAPGDRLA